MLSDLVQALNATSLRFAHFGWSKAPNGDFGVYAEEGLNMLRGSNVSGERAVRVSIDWYTRNPSSSAPGDIEAALDGIPCAWYLNSVLLEEDTGYIHYEWVAEV